MPKTVVFALFRSFLHIPVVLDVLVEGAIQSHFFGQALLEHADAGSIGVSHDDGNMDIGIAHAGESEQQEILVIEIGVVLAGAGHDVVVFQVNVVI